MNSKLYPTILGSVVLLAVLLLFPVYSYNDPDTFWHLELGRHMIESGQVLHHAIHTFYGDRLPYVPHEFAFQIVLALLYGAFGWPGAYLLTAACLFLLVMGLFRLTKVSRKELGLPESHPLLLLLVLLVTSWIYYVYFATRPQMVSAWMIVWFFVQLREFQKSPRWKPALLMTVLSLGVANFHAGVWLVMAVFTGMAAVESAVSRTLTKRRAAVFLAVLLAGLLNPGGIRSLLFILTVTKDNSNMLINEWQPIEFANPENAAILLALLLFALTLPHSLHRKPFRYMLMLGILFLGVTSYKQNLFLWLFLPYFAAAAIEAVPRLRGFRFRFGRKHLMLGLAVGLCANAVWIFSFPPRIDSNKYPVEEMNFILARAGDGVRPKVMAPYGASGYVMFRGGDILTDGRQDPFITDESKGPLGWNAFQRSMFGYGEFLPEVVKEDDPDYVIARRNVSWKLLRDWEKEFGPAVYQGKFGYVFDTGDYAGR